MLYLTVRVKQTPTNPPEDTESAQHSRNQVSPGSESRIWVQLQSPSCDNHISSPSSWHSALPVGRPIVRHGDKLMKSPLCWPSRSSGLLLQRDLHFLPKWPWVQLLLTPQPISRQRWGESLQYHSCPAEAAAIKLTEHLMLWQQEQNLIT